MTQPIETGVPIVGAGPALNFAYPTTRDVPA